MTSQEEFLEKVIVALESAGIDYMISGSLGSSLHGYPRATNDADIVIETSKEHLLHFIELLGSGYYVSRQAVLDAFQRRSMFNVIDIQDGWKADLIIRKDRAYSKQEFARRKKCSFMGMNACVVSPEDSILSKLEWSKDRQSQVQLRDAMGVMAVQKERLDFDYLKKWAKELQVQEDLDNLLNEIKTDDGCNNDND